jgi:probable HAF family extracellular repeat protein
MRPKVLTCVIAIATISMLATSVRLARAQENPQPPRYYVFNLGDPGGGTAAAAASINNIGWIAGDALQRGNASEHAELWVGTPIDLGTLGGANSAVAWPNHNNRGQIAGIAETAEMNPFNEAWSCALANFPTITNQVCFGFLWEQGVMTALPPLSGGIDSYAAGINNQGQIVGWAENGIHDPTCNNTPPFNQVLQFEAVVWGPDLGEMTELSPLALDPDSAATAINDQGQVVGISGLCANAAGTTSAEHAVLWENKNSAPIDLGNFDGGLAWNTPTAINNRGQVVGFGNQQGSPATAFNPIAFVVDRAHPMQAIKPLQGDSNSWAWGINNRGVVVGQSFVVADFPAGRAFIYQHGVAADLNELIQPNSSLELQLANDINDAGEIVGFALDTNTGALVTFLAVPLFAGNQIVAIRRAESNYHSTVNPPGVRRGSAGTFSRLASEAAWSK